MSSHTVNAQSFEEKVINHSGMTLVDFWAEWCGPCKMIAPVLDMVQEELGDKINIVKINVDEEGDLATKYSVRTIPTLILFNNGQVVDSKFGAISKQALIDWIQSKQA